MKWGLFSWLRPKPSPQKINNMSIILIMICGTMIYTYATFRIYFKLICVDLSSVEWVFTGWVKLSGQVPSLHTIVHWWDYSKCNNTRLDKNYRYLFCFLLWSQWKHGFTDPNMCSSKIWDPPKINGSCKDLLKRKFKKYILLT